MRKRTTGLMKLMRLRFRLQRILNRLLGRSKTVYVWNRVGRYRRLWTEAAAEIGAEVEELAEGIWRISDGAGTVIVTNHMTPMDNPVVLRLASHKPVSYRLFEDAGVPVAPHRVFHAADMEAMEAFMQTHPGMYVIKPARGTSAGMGVTTHLKGLAECRRAAALASLFDSQLIIEKLVAGEVYRLLYLEGEMIAASRRRGLWITGDGSTTVGGLIRARCHATGVPVPATGDRDLEATLRAQGLTLDDVPESGRVLLAKSVAAPLTDREEIRTVYTHDATGEICAAIRATGARACAALGTAFAGVDIITLDPSRPLENTGGVVGEINTTPGLHHHCGLEGAAQNPSVPARVLRHLLSRTAAPAAAGAGQGAT